MIFGALASPSVLRFPYSSPFFTSPKRMSRLSSPFASATVQADTLQDPKPKPKPKPWLLVGLGNPGKKYHGTRHNVGFEMIDTIAQVEGISVSSIQFKALFGKGSIGNIPVMLAKPQTFMNASVASSTKRMRSIIDHLKGSREFPRLRIGIGRPPGKMDPVNFVLRPFNRQEREELDFTFQQGLEAVRILVLEGFDKSATFVNSAKSMNLNSG